MRQNNNNISYNARYLFRIWGDMMGGYLGKVAGALFGNKEHISKAMDIITRTGDALVETSEEQRQWALDYLSQTKGQNVTRRFGAIMIFVIWGSMVGLMAFAKLIQAVTGSSGAEIFFQDISGMMADHINTPFGIIMAFYYLTHSLKAFKGK